MISTGNSGAAADYKAVCVPVSICFDALPYLQFFVYMFYVVCVGELRTNTLFHREASARFSHRVQFYSFGLRQFALLPGNRAFNPRHLFPGNLKAKKINKQNKKLQ